VNSQCRSVARSGTIRKWIARLRDSPIEIHTRIRTLFAPKSQIAVTVDEHFVPNYGLDLKEYIQRKDMNGVHHIIKYLWAMDVIGDVKKPGSVLDIACGAGYGSYMISQRFPTTCVVGADYDSRAIDHARENYTRENLTYRVADMVRWGETLGPEKFSWVVCFDTIEHVAHRELIMENLVDHLVPEGTFLFATPCGHPSNLLKPSWECHKLEYSPASLYDFLRRYFGVVLTPDAGNLPHREVFDCLDGTGIPYLLLCNPVVCRRPIEVDNPYKKHSPWDAVSGKLLGEN
jgi:2-polyprenyl-3-methyl-5-hydroxy-6-metoxy-1,4-benzoquinol methylase